MALSAGTLNKYEELKKLISSYGKLAVAYSSGVDSTLLLRVAIDVLGKENVIAITAVSKSFPARELNESKDYCEDNEIKHVYVESQELMIEGIKDNPPNRCYLCKREIFTGIIKAAAKNGITNIAEGSNTDDEGDYRPGMQAIKELGVLSPLRQVRLSKAEIREISKELGLPTWTKPSFACLLSRFVYGEPITDEKIAMVDKAEQLLLDMGFEQFRVRIHDRMARIEVMPSEFDKIMEPASREKIYNDLRDFGFTYVSLDLGGYRTGSMNETLPAEVLDSAIINRH